MGEGKKRGKTSAIVKCTAAVVELQRQKIRASSHRALPTHFTAFPTAPISIASIRSPCFSCVAAAAEGGRSHFAKEKLARMTTVHSIVGTHDKRVGRGIIQRGVIDRFADGRQKLPRKSGIRFPRVAFNPSSTDDGSVTFLMEKIFDG